MRKCGTRISRYFGLWRHKKETKYAPGALTTNVTVFAVVILRDYAAVTVKQKAEKSGAI